MKSELSLNYQEKDRRLSKSKCLLFNKDVIPRLRSLRPGRLPGALEQPARVPLLVNKGKPGHHPQIHQTGHPYTSGRLTSNAHTPQ